MKAALFSVSDKTGIVDFAKNLRRLGYEILSTSGTASYLKEHGIEPVLIENYTGQREILDGRVKTLHPKIHAGILAKRDNPAHLAELKKENFYEIDLVVVNLYPFTSRVKTEARENLAVMTEYIDVGGPTMLRAAAKNFKSVFAVSDYQDYSKVLEQIEIGNEQSALTLRMELASKVFSLLADDNACVADYLRSQLNSRKLEGFATDLPLRLNLQQELRYGENPHQPGAFYCHHGQTALSWEKLWGKELSYNNILDLDAGLKLLRSFQVASAFCAIIKHLNPCGAALAENLSAALKAAKRGDPRSHFGGVIVFNRALDRETADLIREDFAEMVLAPAFDPSALELFKKNKNIRLLKVASTVTADYELRTAAGGVLLQVPDHDTSTLSAAKVVSKRPCTQGELNDLDFAWKLVAHIKSNAICLVKDGVLIGSGAGQMSRVDSVEVAISKARLHNHNLAGAVAASDAFFPFSDGLSALAQAGISAVIAPSGAKRDPEVIEAANTAGVSLLFTADRHFRH